MVSHEDLVREFEHEQKDVVFGSLTNHFQLGLFTDLTLVCQNQSLRAHKTVLSASSKFFRDILRHYPLIMAIDLDKELSPNGITLDFTDLQQLVSTLYCVGNLDTSSRGIESMLLVAQVLGIPTLISFLKRVKTSFPNFTSDHPRSWDRPKAPSNPLLPSVTTQHPEDELARPSAPFPQLPPEIPLHKQERIDPHPSGESHSPSNRAPSQATLASLSSFPFQPLPSPRQGGHEVNPNSSSRVVTSVLESFDPSFLTNLQANQIDDLENALLPHLQNEDSNPEPSPLPAPGSGTSGLNSRKCASASMFPNQEKEQHSVVVDIPPDMDPTYSFDQPTSSGLTPPNFGVRPADPSEVLTQSANPPRTSPLPQFSVLKPNQRVDPSVCAPKPVVLRPDASFSPLSTSTIPETPTPLTPEIPKSDDELEPPSLHEEETEEGLVIDESFEGENRVSQTEDAEIEVNLEKVREGQSFKFAIPGSSKSVTLNFSADALKEMRNSMTGEDHEDANNGSIQDPKLSSSVGKTTSPRHLRSRKRKKKTSPSLVCKSLFACQLCGKAFPNKKLFDRHASFHVEINSSCKVCGKLFPKRWNLEEHMALEHDMGKKGKCKDCNKEFKWDRNLLAHIQLHHPKEIRHRCKFCPLNFIKKRFYIRHHQKRHPNKPETWCKVSQALR
ncbi:hypothetical protein TCAL_02885 [Tigriopus californicus]|uniref:BTB domain-containing protein n=1 Tax=Tigriopus californicus TaxID=6832 RepID=A0A553NWZ3_TIGCA|nr:hypothetical protein TCAL_02885 [Tigriopus californicus]|eukprot:TCALIF_02885-PA protein Name:"Similar to ZNF335 Zinc finger protein 335 (Homo sapiens)" AED:0.32 eAED:0.32 QI:128/1/0.66/1/0.5/0.33/3/0/669